VERRLRHYARSADLLHQLNERTFLMAGDRDFDYSVRSELWLIVWDLGFGIASELGMMTWWPTEMPEMLKYGVP
jgi:hypothetical protein